MKLKILMCAACFGLIMSCGENNDEETSQDESAQGEQNVDTSEDDGNSEDMNSEEIELVPFDGGHEFPNAELVYKSGPTPQDTNNNAVSFSFDVDNYELAVQTPNADHVNCANSTKGQHIHAIIDNEPYTAHYEKDFVLDLDEGWHLGLFFLSRSYHESIKNGSAHHIVQFGSGEKYRKKAWDLSQPMLFYSRPKGEYSAEDSEEILLDFFLANTELSTEGNRVRLTINDQEEFYIDKWQSYKLLNLPKGKVILKLELLDSNGDVMSGPASSITREITVN